MTVATSSTRPGVFYAAMVITLTLMIVTALIPYRQAFAAADQDALWNDQLKDYYFEGKEIQDAAGVFEMTAPQRAEDGAVVPLEINALIPQSDDLYIKTVTILIDQNPVPMAGEFNFFPDSGRANLSLRIRVNAYSPVRAIAETSDGSFFMTSTFVKATGGCSAPAGSDLDVAMARLGKMRFKVRSEYLIDEPVQMQLAVSHPNLTGLQKDQVTTLFIPPHFIKKIRVSFNGQEVMNAITDISISENPNFKFFFKPDGPGTIVAEIEDSEGMSFKKSFEVDEDTS